MTVASALLLAGLLALGIWERSARDRAHAAIPIRIHVNGTRGKSTTTRLIAAALREAGIVTLAKTTGTAPRLILPDGTEREIARRGPANIREQLWFLREARRRRAAAVVVECMAIDPELQAVCEHRIIRATVGVITNVRRDHGDVMGTSLEEVGTALAGTVPRQAVLVVGPSNGTGPIARVAHELGTRVIHVPPAAGDIPEDRSAGHWMAENVAIAMAVVRELGIDEAVARRGMGRAVADPGAVTCASVTIGGRCAQVVDATAANDPDSLARLLGERSAGAVFVFHHRFDRPFRLRQFTDAPPWTRDDDALIVTGGRPDWGTWRRARSAGALGRIEYCSLAQLASRVRRRFRASDTCSMLVLCGNTKGFARKDLLIALQRGDRG